MKELQYFDKICFNIREILEKARNSAVKSVNFAMVSAYWQIGKTIVEEEQKGKERAGYGEALIKERSLKPASGYGNGFTERNLWYMKQFYISFRNMNALRSELSWTHYRLLLKVGSENARSFYLTEAIGSSRKMAWAASPGSCLRRSSAGFKALYVHIENKASAPASKPSIIYFRHR